MKKLLAILLCMAMLCTASFALAEPLTGEADGYGGPIQAEVTLDGDKIAALKLTGDKETPSLGGVALEKLTEAMEQYEGKVTVDPDVPYDYIVYYGYPATPSRDYT